MGIEIVEGVAFDAKRDRNLRAVPVRHLFENNVADLGVKKGAYLRSFLLTFIGLFLPILTKKLLNKQWPTELTLISVGFNQTECK